MADEGEKSCLSKCGFFLKRKNRYCKMRPSNGRMFCGEHLYLSEKSEDLIRRRIPCPLDQKHTVFEDQLEKHLKKCNVAKRRQVVHYEENINIGQGLSEEKDISPRVALRSLPIDKIEECISKVKSYFDGNEMKIRKSICFDENLEGEIEKAGENLTMKKHLHQQSSLIGNLKDCGLMTTDNIFIEFGAGRGLLSHWVQKSLDNQQNVDFLLVDRASTRYKADSYHRGEDQGPSFNRIQIDIQHLNLKKVPLLCQSKQQHITGISKHLCGAATDLALTCLLCQAKETVIDGKRHIKRLKLDSQLIHGLVFALCCHHCCSWRSYVGKEFLGNLGFTQEMFDILCCLSSWATCGSRAVLKNNVEPTSTLPCLEQQPKCHDIEIPEQESCIKRLGYSKEESEEIGRQCKHVIDAGRVAFIKQYGLEADLIYYVEPTVSLENVALLAWNT